MEKIRFPDGCRSRSFDTSSRLEARHRRRAGSNDVGVGYGGNVDPAHQRCRRRRDRSCEPSSTGRPRSPEELGLHRSSVLEDRPHKASRQEVLNCSRSEDHDVSSDRVNRYFGRDVAPKYKHCPIRPADHSTRLSMICRRLSQSEAPKPRQGFLGCQIFTAPECRFVRLRAGPPLARGSPVPRATPYHTLVPHSSVGVWSLVAPERSSATMFG